ncbi:MAG: DUF1501 domain-containing protein [Myxococcota bacterium]
MITHHSHTYTKIGRRGFLTGLAATAAAAAVGAPSITLAEHSSRGRGYKFIFVFALGGWDPLAAFTRKFDAPLLDVEKHAYPVTIGDFELVGHEGRENLEAFFTNHKDRTVLLNGVSTRSVAHEVCERVSMTGSSSGSESDWPTLIASRGGQGRAMPALVLDGPTYPGDLETLVARVGGAGQLDVLAGEFGIDDAGLTMPVEGITGPEVGGIIDSFIQRRAEAMARKTEDALRRKRYAQMATSTERAAVLKRKLVSGDLPIARFYDPEHEASRAFARAVQTLADGLSRTVTLTDQHPWDTHADNRGQTPGLHNLFGLLDGLTRHLQATPGEMVGTLYEETIVVVLSEMGRTPQFNGGEEEGDDYEEGAQLFEGGRDHWPYTSAILTGGPVKGNRTFGAFTDRFTGVGVDPASGELDPKSVGISSAQLGATLLAIADIDPAGLIPNASPIQGIV